MTRHSDRPAMLTIAEAAETLRVSERTIRRWISAKSLTAHRFGRTWRIARRDLEEHLLRHRHEAERRVL